MTAATINNIQNYRNMLAEAKFEDEVKWFSGSEGATTKIVEVGWILRKISPPQKQFFLFRSLKIFLCFAYDVMRQQIVTLLNETFPFQQNLQLSAKTEVNGCVSTDQIVNSWCYDLNDYRSIHLSPGDCNCKPHHWSWLYRKWASYGSP